MKPNANSKWNPISRNQRRACELIYLMRTRRVFLSECENGKAFADEINIYTSIFYIVCRQYLCRWLHNNECEKHESNAET